MPGLDLALFLEFFVKIGAAFLFALPVAWEREKSDRVMGLRTFPLVSVASCAYILVAVSVLGPQSDAQARIMQGLMTGIGFIGGGAILKGKDGVSGTATAASIWTIGIVGGAVAYNRFEIALVIGLANYLVLRFLTPVKEEIGNDPG